MSFRATGGVAGLIRGVDLDTSTLAGVESQELLRLVERSGIEGVQEAISEVARDLPLFEIRIRREAGLASLVCDEGRVPPAAWPLLTYLAARALPLAPERPLQGGEPGGEGES